MNNDGTLPTFISVGLKANREPCFFQNWQSLLPRLIRNPFVTHASAEDTDAVFFDSDLDGDLDLYVASGGKSFSKYDFSYERPFVSSTMVLGNFTVSTTPLPFASPMSSATVAVYDFDQDGDQDIFVGERFKVATYGVPVDGYLAREQRK